MPALRSFRIVGAKALARTSAARQCASPLVIRPFVTRPRRARTLATVVRCHLPPSRVGVSLRFNSFASPGWDMNPAAISSRRVEARARARESAARLTAKAPSIPFFRDGVCPRAVFIGPSWPGCATPTDVKFVSRSARAAGHRLWPPTCPHGRKSDGRSCGNIQRFSGLLLVISSREKAYATQERADRGQRTTRFEIYCLNGLAFGLQDRGYGLAHVRG
jgi:hypothetical protein